MTVSLLLAAVVAAVNPLRVRAALPDRAPAVVAALGALVTWVALLPAAALASSVLDVVSVAPSTMRMGVGVVLLLQGAVGVVTGAPGAEPALAGRRAALVPVAFPVTLTPGLALLVVAASVDRSAPVALAALAGGLVLLPVLAVVWPRPAPPARARALDAAGRLLAGGLVAVGVALLVDGLFDL
jgi:small neutral amino acid transporter SnatA (MarC family)